VHINGFVFKEKKHWGIGLSRDLLNKTLFIIHLPGSRAPRKSLIKDVFPVPDSAKSKK
jgi:hypothetical protein